MTLLMIKNKECKTSKWLYNIQTDSFWESFENAHIHPIAIIEKL